MPKCVFSALVLSMLLPSIAAAQSAQSIGGDLTRLAYVSPQRAFFESNDGKAAQARLSSIESETSREVQSRSAKLKALQQGLAERSSVLAEGARREREQEIDRFSSTSSASWRTRRLDSLASGRIWRMRSLPSSAPRWTRLRRSADCCSC